MENTEGESSEDVHDLMNAQQVFSDYSRLDSRSNRLTKNLKLFFENNRHYCMSKMNLNHPLNCDILQNSTIQENAENLFPLFTPYPFRSSLLLPLLDASSSSLGKDPANQICEDIERFSSHLRTLTTLNVYKKIRAAKEKCLNEAEKKFVETRNQKQGRNRSMELPYSVWNLADKLQSDPDPKFDSNYNWYYTGGNLDTATVQGRTVLFLAGGNQCGDLRAIPLKQTSQNICSFRPKELQSDTFSMNQGKLFQVTAVEHGDIGLVGVRTLHKCTVLQCNRESTCSLKLLQTRSSVKSTPYTHLALSPWDQTEYSVTDINQRMQIYDLNTNERKYRLQHYKYKNSTQWCGVHYSYSSPNTIFFSSYKKVLTLDLRDPSVKETLLDIGTLHLPQCESISVSENSITSSTLQYIATSHQLFTVDIRQKGKIVQRWTHMLQGPPQYLKLCLDTQGLELACLGNTESSEIISIINEWPEEDLALFPVGRCAPYLLGTLDDTLSSAKLKGLCLRPSIQRRFKLGLTGLCCVSRSKPVVMCSTAAGDVWSQRVQPKFAERDVQKEELCMEAALTLWQEQVKELELNDQVPTLYYSSLLNDGHLKRIIMEEIDEVSKSKEKPKVTKPSWQLTLSQLFGSKDIFGDKLLSVWGIKSATDWDNESSKVYESACIPPSTPAKLERVKEWLSTNVLPQENVQSQESMLMSQTTQMSFPQSLYSASQIQPSNIYTNTQDSVAVNDGQGTSDITFLKKISSSKYSKVPLLKRKRTDGF